ncbi:MAG: MurR/RpiR family transcriptional regulator [Erysipelotrichaceae bacterium]|nr:MurR/RpiR family transcriptional regulator [Erysipelotrichaceae bacterium]
MNIIDTIKLNQDNFSKTEQKVANFILMNPEYVETHTISKLATETDTSTSAVLRFCQSLGFKGYKDFRYEMIQYIHTSHHPLDSSDLLNQLMSTYNQVFSQFRNLDRDIVIKLVNDLLNNQIIYISGIYYSSLPAMHLSMGLLDLGIQNHVLTDYITIGHNSRVINNEAMVIHFSLSGQKSELQRHIPDLIKTLPEKSYLITMNENGELGKFFTHKIVLPGHTFKNQSVFDIQSISMVFVEMILSLIHNEL